MDVKTFRDVQVKDAATGQVSAVFATLGVVDSDGDVIEPGAIKSGAPVRISAYGHRSWQGALPVGKGTVSEVGNELVFDGQFFMSTVSGRDTFEVVKEMADLQEWSFSLENMTTERGELDGKAVRFIKAVDVTEVSPVLKGAGVNTRTLAVKNRKQTASDLHVALVEAGRDRFGGDDVHVYVADYDVDELWAVYDVWSDEDDRMVQVSFSRDGDTVTLADDATDVERVTNYRAKSAKFSEHIDTVKTAVVELGDRAREIVTLRASKGKTIGTDAASALTELVERAKEIEALLGSDDDPETPADPAPSTDDLSDGDDVLAREFARFVANSTDTGVTA